VSDEMPTRASESDHGPKRDPSEVSQVDARSFLAVRDVARRFGVSNGCVYALIEGRLLPHVRIGQGRGTIRISEADLAEFVAKNHVARQEPTDISAAPAPVSRPKLKHIKL
jgi:excisionase family DNA binding protein